MKYLANCGLILLSLCLIQPGWAESNHHMRPEALQAAPTHAASKPTFFGDCYIEIMNDSFSNVTIYGRYDDGVPLTPFNVYSYEYSHYIDMFYNDYCHSGLYLSVVAFSGHTIFSGYLFTGSTIHVVPLTRGKLKAVVETHQPSPHQE